MICCNSIWVVLHVCLPMELNVIPDITIAARSTFSFFLRMLIKNSKDRSGRTTYKLSINHSSNAVSASKMSFGLWSIFHTLHMKGFVTVLCFCTFARCHRKLSIIFDIQLLAPHTYIYYATMKWYGGNINHTSAWTY